MYGIDFNKRLDLNKQILYIIMRIMSQDTVVKADIQQNSNATDEKMMQIRPGLCVEIADVKLKNPVTTSSGTFGYAQEFQNLIDLNRRVTQTGICKERWK
jgi:hypothetical protein